MSVRQKAISAINTHGALLVYPLDNKKEPLSIWSALYPKSKMKWEWDSNGDNRVAGLWILREQLSQSNEVIYAKWFKGRATFFSIEVYRALLSYFCSARYGEALRLSSDPGRVLEALEMDSPLSTKQLKVAVELQGKAFEAQYNRAMKPLWERLLVVGYGEMNDSSFPSLLMGASKNIFEQIWLEALELDPKKAENLLLKMLGDENSFWEFAKKIHSK